MRKALKSKFNFFAKLRVFESWWQEKDLSEWDQSSSVYRQYSSISGGNPERIKCLPIG